MLLLNLILAIVWMALQGSFTLVDLLVGFALGFLILGLTQRVLVEQFDDLERRREGRPNRGYVQQTWRVIALIGFALWAIVKSNIEVAKIVLNPRHVFRPGIVAVPLDIKSDLGITVLANLITLTPGTVTLDVSSDRRTIYMHVMDVQDAERLRDETKEQFERRVMELLP
jgi:multicomponent Na+:H+ antiporter subunit E